MKIFVEDSNQSSVLDKIDDNGNNALFSAPDNNTSNTAIRSRNIANVFDISRIQKILEEKGIMNEILPMRKIKDNIYAMYIRTPYVGVSTGISKDVKDGARIALVVDYSTNGALAISRSGADKNQMILISSIANKCIKPPFKLDNTLRQKL